MYICHKIKIKKIRAGSIILRKCLL